MTEEWLWLWFSYFKQNKNYERYCVAVREDNTAAQRRLEKSYPKIAELYEDWGDIHSFDPREKNKKFYIEWLSTRKHLFFKSKLPPVSLVIATPTTLDKNYLYIKVPILPQVTKVTKEASTLIRKTYNTPKIKQQRKRSNVKYQLATKVQSDVVRHGVRKALNVWDMFYTPAGKKLLVKDVVYMIERRVKNPQHNTWSNYWGWSTASRKRAGNDDDLKTQVRRYKREAKFIIENTMYGKFPVKKAITK